MRVDARVYIKAKRAGRATSVRVAPTGTAVEQYQVPLGQRHSLKDAGVVGMPSWSDRSTQTETWTKVPRLSTTCPRRAIVFDGGRRDIDKTTELGDEFDGTSINSSKWTVTSPVTISGSVISVVGANTFRGVASNTQFGTGYAFRSRSIITGTTSGGYDSSSVGWLGTTALNSTPQSLFVWYASGTFRFAARNHLVGSSSVEPLTNDLAYHIWEIRRNGSASSIFASDNTVVGTLTTEVPTSSMSAIPLRIWQTGGTNHTDWCFVRKYVASEPVAGTAQPSATNRAMSRPMSHADLIRAVCA